MVVGITASCRASLTIHGSNTCDRLLQKQAGKPTVYRHGTGANKPAAPAEQLLALAGRGLA